MALTTKPKVEKQKVFTIKDYLATKNGEKHDVLPMNKRKKPVVSKTDKDEE